jgi:hypothetical protein
MSELQLERQVNAHSIFSPATGFIQRGGFDWSCNPYVGCSFGCVYCYALFLPQNRRPREDWGKWFQAKVNAVELARKQAPKVAGKAVYLSTVTDPYLPAERSLALTRGILAVILPYQPRLLVQTRGPLVTRDIDLFAQFRAVRINISIPTDSEQVRQAFEPKAPPLERRWEGVSKRPTGSDGEKTSSGARWNSLSPTTTARTANTAAIPRTTGCDMTDLDLVTICWPHHTFNYRTRLADCLDANLLSQESSEGSGPGSWSGKVAPGQFS